jgi:hypothetical protein
MISFQPLKLPLVACGHAPPGLAPKSCFFHGPIPLPRAIGGSQRSRLINLPVSGMVLVRMSERSRGES